MATPVGGLAESIERPGIGLMARDVSSQALDETIRGLFTAGPEPFIENIREVKRTQTWDAFAAAIISQP